MSIENFNTLPNYITALVFFGIFLYMEIINRKQRKQIEEWRKEWF